MPKKIARGIINKKADYILGLKRNQSTLHDDMQELFADKDLIKDAKYHSEVDADHGRIETRRCTVVSG